MINKSFLILFSARRLVRWDCVCMENPFDSVEGRVLFLISSSHPRNFLQMIYGISTILISMVLKEGFNSQHCWPKKFPISTTCWSFRRMSLSAIYLPLYHSSPLLTIIHGCLPFYYLLDSIKWKEMEGECCEIYCWVTGEYKILNKNIFSWWWGFIKGKVATARM